jgi:lipase ATG15
MRIPLVAKVAHALLPYLDPSSPSHTSASGQLLPSSSSLTFKPIHAHAHAFLNSSDTSPTLLLHNASSHASAYLSSTSDGNAESFLLAGDPLTIRTRQITIRRPVVRPPRMVSWALSARQKRKRRNTGMFPWATPRPLERNMTDQRAESWEAPDFDDLSKTNGWEDVEVVAPDVTDRQTLLTLAKMTSNAYITPDSGEWWPTGDWNASVPFGWESEADGLRGHIVSWHLSKALQNEMDPIVGLGF